MDGIHGGIAFDVSSLEVGNRVVSITGTVANGGNVEVTYRVHLNVLHRGATLSDVSGSFVLSEGESTPVPALTVAVGLMDVGEVLGIAAVLERLDPVPSPNVAEVTGSFTETEIFVPEVGLLFTLIAYRVANIDFGTMFVEFDLVNPTDTDNTYHVEVLTKVDSNGFLQDTRGPMTDDPTIRAGRKFGESFSTPAYPISLIRNISNPRVEAEIRIWQTNIEPNVQLVQQLNLGRLSLLP